MLGRKRRIQELETALALQSMELEEIMPMTAVSALRLMAGIGDDADQGTMDGLDEETKDELYGRMAALVLNAKDFLDGLGIKGEPNEEAAPS